MAADVVDAPSLQTSAQPEEQSSEAIAARPSPFEKRRRGESPKQISARPQEQISAEHHARDAARRSSLRVRQAKAINRREWIVACLSSRPSSTKALTEQLTVAGIVVTERTVRSDLAQLEAEGRVAPRGRSGSPSRYWKVR